MVPGMQRPWTARRVPGSRRTKDVSPLVCAQPTRDRREVHAPQHLTSKDHRVYVGQRHGLVALFAYVAAVEGHREQHRLPGLAGLQGAVQGDWAVFRIRGPRNRVAYPCRPSRDATPLRPPRHHRGITAVAPGAFHAPHESPFQGNSA